MRARVAHVALLAALLAAPAAAGTLFGEDVADTTVAVAVSGSENDPVLAKQAEQIIEESLRRNDVRVLGRQGLDRLLEDELYKAVVANKSATAMLEIKKKYETDVLFMVEVAAEATPGIGLNWVGTASLSGTAFRTANASILGSAVSPPLGTTGYPSALGETDLAARQRAVQRATNGLLLRAALPNVNVPEMDPSVTPERLWSLDGGGDAAAIDVAIDSRTFVMLEGDGATLRELESGAEIERWSFRNAGGAAIALRPDAAGFAAADGKGRVLLCNRGNPRCIELNARAAKKVTWLRFDADGSRLGAAGKNGTVLVWKLSGGGPPSTWAAHGKGPSTLFFLDDARRLATTSSAERAVRIWDAPGGKPLRTFDQEIETGELVTADCAVPCRVMALVLKEIHRARFAPMGGVSGDIGSLRQDREYIRLIDSGSGKEITRFEAHDERIVSLAFGPSSRFLASGDETGNLKIWDTERARELAGLQLPGKGKDVVVRLTRDGRYLVAQRAGTGTAAWLLR